MRKPGYETAGQYQRPVVASEAEQENEPTSDAEPTKPKKKRTKKAVSDESVPY